MKTRTMFLIWAAVTACGGEPAGQPAAGDSKLAMPAAAAPAADAPAAAKSDAEKTVADVAVGSPDHTTLVAALQAAGLVPALKSPGGVYTVFAPVNAAFDALPAGTVDTLLKPENKAELKRILQHHAAVPIIAVAQMKDGGTLTMADGTPVTFHVVDGKTMVEDANILASISAVNGVVHVVDKVIVPAAKK